MQFLEFLKAIIIGIVEGITEWLPISSTGHMILLDELISLNVSDAFMEMFLVVIQLGAILAVPVYFFDRLNPFSKKKSDAERKSTLNLWGKVIVGVIPAGVIGILLDDIIDEHLSSYIVVAATLVIYGILFIAVEHFLGKKPRRVETIDELTYRDALIIGGYQVLSLIPGTSRSGATILGGMLSGTSRTVAAEFSFFMAIPVMLGASLLKILKFVVGGFSASGLEIGLLLVGIAVAFLTSLLAIKFLMDFVKRHSFTPFGIYRIILGVAVVAYSIFS